MTVSGSTAIYKIPFKPCVRNLIQRYSVEKDREACQDMDDSEVDKDSGEFTSDESSERNGEASDNIIH